MLVNMPAQEPSGNSCRFPKRLLIDGGNADEARFRLNKPLLDGQEGDDFPQNIASKIHDGEALLPISDQDLTPEERKAHGNYPSPVHSNHDNKTV